MTETTRPADFSFPTIIPHLRDDTLTGHTHYSRLNVTPAEFRSYFVPMEDEAPLTIVDVYLRGWQSLELACRCGRLVLVNFEELGPAAWSAPSIAGLVTRFRCRSCSGPAVAAALFRRGYRHEGWPERRLPLLVRPAIEGS